MKVTHQQLFERVFRFIVAQGKPGTKRGGPNGRCAYLGEDGSRCAIGCLFKTDEYSNAVAHTLEGSIIRSEARALLDVEPPDSSVAKPFFALLEELQMAHDYAKNDAFDLATMTRPATSEDVGPRFVELFKKNMNYAASKFSLVVPADLKTQFSARW